MFKKAALLLFLVMISSSVVLADFPLNSIKAGPRPAKSGFELVMINVPMFKWERDRAELESIGARLIGTSTDIRQDGSEKTSRIRAIFIVSGNWKHRIKKAEPRLISRANAQIVVERFALQKNDNTMRVVGLKQVRLNFSTVKEAKDILDLIAFMGGAASETRSWLFDLDHYCSAYDKQLEEFKEGPQEYQDWYDVTTIKIRTAEWLKNNSYIFYVRKPFNGPLAKRPFNIPERINWLPGAVQKDAAEFGTNEAIKYLRRVFTNPHAMESW